MKVILVAGMGLLPIEAAKSIKQRGDELYIVTFTEQLSKSFDEYADEVTTFSITQVGKILKYIKSVGAEKLYFVGKINKSVLDQKLKFDLKAILMLARLKDRQEDTLMLAIVKEIEKLGVKVGSQMEVLSHLTLKPGVYSKKKPSKMQMKDVAFAFEKAKGISGLDLGQVIISKNTTVLAIESMDGTDSAIKRGAELAHHEGFTFVKVAKPQQDMRFDLPVIGMDTMRTFGEEGGAVFATEAEFTFIIELQECLDYANKHNMVFMAYSKQ